MDNYEAVKEVAKDPQLAAEKNKATAPTSGGRPLNLDANSKPGQFLNDPWSCGHGGKK